MNNEKKEKNLEFLLPIFLFVLMTAITYLVFIPRFGYFKDDWYLMYAAGAKGAAAFRDIFIVDRPLRALVMIPAYTLFGNNPILYNLSAWVFRVLSGIFFYLFLLKLWPKQKMTAWLVGLFYLIYPGFLSQFNGIDYQSQMVSLAVMMLSLFLLVSAYQAQGNAIHVFLFFTLCLLVTFYLGLVEYFIGMEAFKLVCIILLVFRDETKLGERVKKIAFWAAYSLMVSVPFLFWRLFIFKSERGATDVDLQLSDVLSNPLHFVLGWLQTLSADMFDSLVRAWYEPLRRLSIQFSVADWIPAIGIALLITAIWILYQCGKNDGNGLSVAGSRWRREAFLLGLSLMIFGLLPIIIVGRSADFKNFSRYTLVASAGVALLLQVGLSLIPNLYLQNMLVTLFLISASLTHYVNGLANSRETERMNAFWWQISWRIPQMEQGTTLLANYPDIVIEEDYFVWGPANLIYYPDSMNADYPQPGVYAALVNDDTIQKILAHEKQEFSNRRSIRTYPNYRNVLIISQPSLNSCVQVLDGAQPEISSYEDVRLIKVGSYSEIEHILPKDVSHIPPQIPFGSEPRQSWCFYYEKASLARQLNDWKEVTRLGEEASQRGFKPIDQIEWMPFLQAYILAGDIASLKTTASAITDEKVRQQACEIFSEMKDLNKGVSSAVQTAFCLSK